MRQFEISRELERKLKKLFKKNKKQYEIIFKKINEILTTNSLEHYKNLKGDLAGSKRVHIDKHFVLVFRCNKSENKLYFDDFDHHDAVY